MFGVSALLVKAVIMQAMDDWAIVFTHPSCTCCSLSRRARSSPTTRIRCGRLADVVPGDERDGASGRDGTGPDRVGRDIKVSVKTALFLGIVLALMIRAVVELARLAAVRADIVHEHHMAHLGLDEDFVQTDTGKMPPVEANSRVVERGRWAVEPLSA